MSLSDEKKQIYDLVTAKIKQYLDETRDDLVDEVFIILREFEQK